MDTGQFHNLSNLPWTVATKWTCEALVKCFSIGNMEQRGGGLRNEEGGGIEPPFSEIFIFSLTAFAMFRKETGIFF